MDLTILIVSYNTRELTIECLESIIRQTNDITYEIVVIDNASRDGTCDAIRAQYPDVKLIESEHNLGFAEGNNVAAKLARGDRILLLNPDTLVIEGAIDRLVAFARRTPDARIWGGKTIFPDGSLNASCLGDLTPWSLFCRATGLTWIFKRSPLFNPESIHSWCRFEKEMDVDVVVGCFLLIDRSLWERLRGFDPRFFMYGEESDLCLRGRKMGASPRVDPRAVVIHYGGGSETSTEEKLIKVLRGQVTLMRVHWSPLARVYGHYAFIFMCFLRAFATKFMPSPLREGAGKDGRRDIWPSVYRRRNEWLEGWTR